MTETLAIVVFARLDSTRLPGKALLPIAGRALLGRVLDRLAPVGLPRIVATSDRAVDDPIAAFAEADGARVFRGDAHDVAGRALACLGAHGFDGLVRISGDSPFIDPDLVAQMVDRHRRTGAEVTTNVFPRSFPKGQSVEVLSTGALTRVAALCRSAADREHVTTVIYRHPDRFRLEAVGSPKPRWADVAMTVDTSEDYQRAEALAGLADAGASLDALISAVESRQQEAIA